RIARSVAAVSLAVIMFTGAAGCTSAPTPSASPGPSVEPWVAPEHPVQVVGGEFVDTRTGDAFPVRGTNYFNIVRADGGLEDRFFSPAVFDADRVAADFQSLADRGYTTVRLFLDSCSIGPECITQEGVDGLDGEFLDVIAETIRIAHETGIFLLLT